MRWSMELSGLVLAVLSAGLVVGVEGRDPDKQGHRVKQSASEARGQRGQTSQFNPSYYYNNEKSTERLSHKAKKQKPNIVFVITDDQDTELGSLNFMPKTLRILRDGGAIFPNAFVTTPMCCPSRSSMLTGMYVHNHNTYTNNDNCSSQAWRDKHETRSFGTYLNSAGYRTGYFGKYLNEYNGEYIPPGWTEWMGLIKNTRFYNYTVNFNGRRIKHGDDYHKDYFTDLVANDSVNFLRQSKKHFPTRPVAMVLSVPAPHGPEDSAPQYQNLFYDVKTHRTQSWNFAPNPDKQWLLQFVGKMSPLQIAFTDLLHTKRLQTLQSVDDAVEKVYNELYRLGELDNTYIIFTSDHGYHLGQFGLVKGKAMPYEFDIKVPFMMRGPNIKQGTRMPNIVLNIDIAPTLLDIAGVPIPDHMDGSSILDLFNNSNSFGRVHVKRKEKWRDTFLVERGKLTPKKLKIKDRIEAQQKVLDKERQMFEECSRPMYQSPCKDEQRWECRRNELGKLRLYACPVKPNLSSRSSGSQRCRCKSVERVMDWLNETEGLYEPSSLERKLQLDFLRHHVNQPGRIQPNSFMKKLQQSHLTENGTQEPENFNTTESPSINQSWIPVNVDGVSIPCQMTRDGAIVCERFVYSSLEHWEQQRNAADYLIKYYSSQLDYLKSVQKHLENVKPDIADANNSASSVTNDQSRENVMSSSLEDEERGEEGEEYELLDDDRNITSVVLPHVSKRSVPAAALNTSATQQFSEYTDIIEADSEECDCSIYDDDEEEEDFADDDSNEEIDDINKSRKYEMRRDRAELLMERLSRMDNRQKRRQEKKELHSGRGGRIFYKKKHHRRDPRLHPAFNISLAVSSTQDETDLLPPEWSGDDLTLYSSRHDPVCSKNGLECSRMDNDHWKVPPYWTYGPFCFCPNSNNNTYWCMRSINDTHNFLFCEYITGFISYYDILADPSQLRNAVHDLSYAVLQQLHARLERLKGCKGARECNMKYLNVDRGRVRKRHNQWKLNKMQRDSAHSLSRRQRRRLAQRG